ncbi:ABC transporter substrate-binding protein [Fusobacterium sp. PH5-44]|uniref:ABC transporter substrate-binding protein n=1 Tax=unclassified Fusobacterium TaxID=2648384 RepID=UPI003D1F15C3
MKKFLLMIFIVILTACQKESIKIPSENIVTDSIIISQKESPQTLDPLEANDIYSKRIISNIYSRLIDLDKSNKIIPSIAESYEFIDDFSVRFNIKKNVLFHNNEALTTEDIKYSLDRIRYSCNKGSLLKEVKDISIIDKNTIVITSKVPIRDILVNFSDINTSIVNKKICLINNNTYPMPIGTGHFKVSDHSDPKNIILTSFNSPLMSNQSIQTINIVTIPSESDRLVFLESDEHQIAFDIGTTGKRAINELENISVNSAYTLSTCYLGINHNNSILKNLQIRKAIVNGIDIDNTLNDLFMTNNTKANSIISPSYIEYSKYARTYDFFQNGALDLLNNSIGLNKRLSFNLIYKKNNSDHKRICDTIKENLTQINVHISLISCSEEEFIQKIEKKDYDLYIDDTPSDEKNIHNLLRAILYGKNKGNSPKFDKLLDEIRKESDYSKRIIEYENIQEFINDNILVYPVYFHSIDVGYSNKIKYLNLLPDNIINFNELKF